MMSELYFLIFFQYFIQITSMSPKRDNLNAIPRYIISGKSKQNVK